MQIFLRIPNTYPEMYIERIVSQAPKLNLIDGQ